MVFLSGTRLQSDALLLSLQEGDNRPNITLPYRAGIILSPGYPAQLSFCDKLTILDILAKSRVPFFDCLWRFVAPANHVVKFTFHDVLIREAAWKHCILIIRPEFVLQCN